MLRRSIGSRTWPVRRPDERDPGRAAAPVPRRRRGREAAADALDRGHSAAALRNYRIARAAAQARSQASSRMIGVASAVRVEAVDLDAGAADHEVRVHARHVAGRERWHRSPCPARPSERTYAVGPGRRRCGTWRSRRRACRGTRARCGARPTRRRRARPRRAAKRTSSVQPELRRCIPSAPVEALTSTMRPASRSGARGRAPRCRVPPVCSGSVSGRCRRRGCRSGRRERPLRSGMFGDRAPDPGPSSSRRPTSTTCAG